MKYLLVVVIAFVAVVAADEDWKPITDRATYQKMSEDCVKETGVSDDQLEKVPHLELPTDKEILAFVLCMVTKTGVFTEDKGYNVDRLVTQFDVFYKNADQVRDIVSGCVDSNEQKSSPGEWAVRGQICLVKSKLGEILTGKEERNRS